MNFNPIYHFIVAGIRLQLLITLVILFGISFSAHSQRAKSVDTESLHSPVDFAKKVYFKKIGLSSRLYNGPIYLQKYPGVKGHQYYSSDYWAYGAISYLGLMYDSVQLKYDILHDKVIVGSLDERNRMVDIELNKENINWFRLEESIFIPVVGSHEYHGMHQLVHSGKSKLLIKRKKMIGQAQSSSGTHESFFTKDKILIESKNQFFEITNANSIYKVYPQYKDLLKKYRKSLGLDYKRQKEKYLIELIKYGDSLNN